MAATKEKGADGAAKPAAASPEDETARPQGAAMDMLLTDAAGDGSGIGRFLPGKALVKAGAPAGAAARPRGQARGGSASSRPRSGPGAPTWSPRKGDRRFKDEAWSGNPAFRRLQQLYLLWAARSTA